MYLETERLIIKDLDQAMAESIQLNSLDDDNRRFLPDEVFETQEEALSRIQYLISSYQSREGPFVYALLLKEGRQIGHVQLVGFQKAWEIGFHIGQAYRGLGYATEAVKAFLPAIMEKLDLPVVYGLCDRENMGSRRVLEKNSFTLIQEGGGPCQGEVRPICKYFFADPLRLEKLVDQLASSDDQKAYRSMKELDAISQETDAVYPFIKTFAVLQKDSNSYIRTRGLILIASNARWDQAGQIDGFIDSYLEHIKDPSPITARQCVKSLTLIARYRPGLRARIAEALMTADPSGYPESMSGLLLKDIDQALDQIKKMTSSG